MKKPSAPQRAKMPLRTLLAAGIAAAAPHVAQAADYALIMGIGAYQPPVNPLPGIDKDVAIAQRIAQGMGVPASNMRIMSDGQVTVAGITNALRDLESKLGPGDRAFIYYSGHGTQEESSTPGSRCSEGLVAVDGSTYYDRDLQAALERVASKAGQLIMFNDSCFSGGAATKFRGSQQAGVAKFFTKSGGAGQCGEPVNIVKNSVRGLSRISKEKGVNFVYIAASTENEVSIATPMGSAATVAWEACLSNPSTDRNRSGILSAAELQQCAQAHLDRAGHRQHVTTLGNAELPMSFASGTVDPQTDADAATVSAAMLEDIRNSANQSIEVELQTRTRVKINQDPLQFSVRSSKPGYLYLLQVGSDGKLFNLLFPNDLDQDNYIQANGQVQLPRGKWAVRAGGPVGESHVMAIVSDVRKDFRSLASKQGPFKSGRFTVSVRKNLFVEAVGGESTQRASFGASRVIAIREDQ